MAILGLQGVRGGLASRPLRLHSPGRCNCSVKRCWRSTPARIICCAFFQYRCPSSGRLGAGAARRPGLARRGSAAIRNISICCRLASSAPAKEKMLTSCSPRWGDGGGCAAAAEPIPLAAAGSAERLFAINPRAADAVRSHAGGGSSRRQ